VAQAMGRRTLRTGDLVVPNTMGRLLTMYDKAGGGDTVGLFSFGLYLGGELTPASTNKTTKKHETISSALVLDSKSMKYGWVPRKFLKRVD